MLSDVVAEIRYVARFKRFHLEQQRRATLALGGFLRTMLGYYEAETAAEKRSAVERTARLIECGEAALRIEELTTRPGELTGGEKRSLAAARKKEQRLRADLPEYGDYADAIMAALLARRPHDEQRAMLERRMAELAGYLPVAAWAEGVRGLSPLGVAEIVGVAGDIGEWRTRSNLWKRFGLVPHDGKSYATWRAKGGLSKADWVRAGYSPSRRSVAWNICDVLIKAGGEYYHLYVDMKAEEANKAEAAGLVVKPAASIRKAEASTCISLGHIDNRAKRRMTQRFLCDLRGEWRRANKAETTRSEAAQPAADSIASPGQGTDAASADTCRVPGGAFFIERVDKKTARLGDTRVTPHARPDKDAA